MYQVVLVVTPFNYHAKGRKAIDSHNNTDKDNSLTSLDTTILQCLKEADKGLRNGTLMLAVRNRIFADRFTRSLDRLISLEYIVRTEYKASVYYSITLEGRAVLDELNEILISIVHNRPL